MKAYFVERECFSSHFGILIATFLAGLLLSVAALAQTRGTPPSVAPAPATVQPGAERPSDPEREVFLKSMSLIPLPGKGCFKAVYPNKTWQPAECAPPPASPNPRALQPRADRLTVGNGTDYFLNDSGSITSATGSFPSVNGVTSVYSPTYTNPPTPTVVYPNTYSLQINANTFDSTLCNGLQQCGWQQFIFSQSQCGDRPCVFVEYWLFYHSKPCPPGLPDANWYYYSGPLDTISGCYLNTKPAIVDPAPAIADLAKLKLMGTVSTTTPDTAFLSTSDGTVFSSQGAVNYLGIVGAWQGAEFNLFGDCCSYEAYLNSGSNIKVSLSADSGTITCTNTGFDGTTAETNNLSLVPGSCSLIGGSSPAIMFTECGGGPLPQGDTVAGATGSTASATLTITVIAATPCAAPQ